MKTKAWRRVYAPLLLGVLLSGCSSEPGTEDMLAAMNNNPKFQATLILATDPRAANPEAAIARLKNSGVIEKSGCAQAQGAPGYVCDFRWGSRQPDGTVRYGTPLKGRFYKSGSGWAVEF